MSILLQAVVDSTNAVAAQANPEQKISILDLLAKGGVLMYPLYLLFILAIYIFFERFLLFRKLTKTDPNFMQIVHDNIVTDNIKSAESLARNTNTPVGAMIYKGLKRIGSPIDAIEKSMENTAEIELYKMERHLKILSLIASIAPMFGFLGTIAGMVQLFYEINTTGNFELSVIAGGIYVKMITSGTGLVIGLIAYIMHSYLSTQIDKTTNDLEIASDIFLETLQEPTN